MNLSSGQRTRRILDAVRHHDQKADRGHEQAPPAAARSGRFDLLELQRLAGNRAMRGQLTVQRFESGEHLKLGDRGADRSQAQQVSLAADYQVTYGEMIAMAGDYFGSLAQMRQLAANAGTGPGSREEIEYVRVVHIRGDKAKENDYSEPARKAADQRYYQLALDNRSHFLNPEGRPGSTEDRAGGAHPELRLEWTGLLPGFVQQLVVPRAGAGYRHYHMEALFLAYVAGFEGRGMAEAIAPEAFGAHYLTDSFSGGHLRTARAGMQEYWNPKQPMFGYNLAGFIAQALAIRIGDANAHISREMAYQGFLWKSGTMEEVSAKLAEKGALGFGDVVSGAVHDLDSDRGVMSDVAGARVRLFGDGKLGGDTERLAENAVDYSHNDLTRAWLVGRRRGPLDQVLPPVTEGKLLGAEQMLPTVVADSELAADDKSVRWEVASADTLLDDPLFQRALRIFGGNKASELAEIKDTLPDVAKPHFEPAVVAPFRTDPVAVVRRVLHWTPDTGGGLFGHNQDDNALDYYNEASSKGAVGTLSVRQRVKLIRDLLDGYTGGDEEDAVLDLVQANSAHSQAVIAQIGWARLEDELGGRFSKKFPETDYR